MAGMFRFLPVACTAGTCEHTDGAHIYYRSRRCYSGECTHARQGLHCGEGMPPAANTERLVIMTETAAMESARKVWPEAEGFEPAPGGGWTFRCGGGYASVSDSGAVAAHPQGTRSDARRFMPRGVSHG